MKYLLQRLVFLGFLSLSSLFAVGTVVTNDIIINEIMYLPSSLRSSEEFIELYNRGSNQVNLLGWRFSKGISFTFSNAVMMPPGYYVVVAADLAAFQAKYPTVLNVVGGWQGGLGNGGEEIQLEDADGNNVDSVTYADEGDWATRALRPDPLRALPGWEWLTLHDGQGSSAELINPVLSNNSGQNWAPSQVLHGTPGMPNSVRSSDIAPMILDVTHSPPVPTSSDLVTVTCRILDEYAGAASVTLWWRDASTVSPPPFTALGMVDDGQHGDVLSGDGIYGAILPSLPNWTVVEFYVEATDGDQSRTWPAIAQQLNGSYAQIANAHYQVDDTVYSGAQPLLRLILTEANRAAFVAQTHQSDAQANATVISSDGVGTKIRHNVGVRYRGAGSRGSSTPNFRVNIPSDNLWNGVEAINLNFQYPHVQIVGSALSLKSGLPAANARAAQVRLNGVNPGNAGSPQFGVYALLEVFNSDWADNHLPLDPGGNIYRGSTGNHSARLEFLGTNYVSYLSAGYLKNSNEAENDWSDMFALTLALTTNADNATYAQAVRQMADVEMWMRYFAVFTVFASAETSLATGRGDDWAAYRGEVDPRFMLLPHDLDSIFGRQGGSPTWNLFRMLPWINVSQPSSPNTTVLNRFMTHPDFVPIYFRELKRLIDTVFSPEQLDPLLDHLLGDFVPEAEINGMKQFAVNRNAYILSQLPLTYSVSSGLPVVDGYFQTSSATLSLNGTANAIDTRRVVVGQQTGTYIAWTNQSSTWYSGNWSVTGVPLRPGLNRVTVSFLGETDQEVHRENVEVYYNDGSIVEVSGSLTSNTTWTAASGPYRLNGTVSVPAGLRLTIQPGTTLFFAQGASLVVNGQLLAEGTETERIRLGRVPGSGITWSGLVFNNSNQTNRLAFADLEYASANDAVRLVNSILLIDHVTWSRTDRTIIDLNNSSLHVRNSVFPTIVNNETIHGVGMPANGFVIIESNYFGGTTGYSDIIDFTGGQWPGPILQVYDNIFDGGSDDALDLDNTDAHIEGNVFMNIHQDASRDSGSYAIATDAGTDLEVVRNIFFNNDHALLLKNGASAIFDNNTVYHIRTNTFSAYPAAVISFGEPDRAVAGGFGASLDGNLFWDVDGDRHLLFFTNDLMFLSVEHSILSGTNHPGIGNRDEDPRFVTRGTNGMTFASILNDLSLLPGSPAIGTGPNGLDMGALVPRGASISGEPLSPTSRTNITLTVRGPGISTYRYRLNDGPFGPETSVLIPIELTGLADGVYSVSVIGKNSANVWQEIDQATVSRTWTVQSGLPRLILNEVLARNNTAVAQPDESFPDLIELYNAGGVTVDLKGLGITDDPLVPYKFQFPAGPSLGPGQYLVLIAANQSTNPGIHLGFALDQRGDGVYLYDRAGGAGMLDSVLFGPQLPDLSIGRNAQGTWTLNRPTLGGDNQVEATANPYLLKINEWGADGQTAFTDDFVELYNPETAPVALAGLFLTDNPVGYPERHRIAELSFMAARGHLAFIADGNIESGPDHLSFKLSPDQGELALLDGQLNLIDHICYGPQSTDISEGRQPSGAVARSFFGPPTQTQPTPGGPNPGQGGTGVITNITVALLPRATDWRYNRNGTDLGTGWRLPAYNDSGWPVGQALLGVEGAFLPPPGLNTSFPSYNSDQITYYFRKTFVVNTNVSDYDLQLATVLDDAAVIYLNGNELLRIRMPGGFIAFNTLGTTVISDASEEFWRVSGGGGLLVQGTNTLAVEVHQSQPPSSDIVWGMALEAIKTDTIFPVFNVVLNEVMANNLSVTHSGDTNITDWVEIYNPAELEADLSGLSLSDDILEPRRWVFPAGISIAPQGYLIVNFDSSAPASTNAAGPLNTGFGLRRGGDDVLLFDTPEQGGGLLGSIAFGLQAGDFTIGRVPNATGFWCLTVPTPGSQNLAATLASSANLKINEWMANPSGGDDDYFEIYNPNAQPVELTGLYLTDDFLDKKQYRIPELSFIGIDASAFALFIADNNTGNRADHVNFRLSGDGEQIAVYRPNESLIDSVVFGEQADGISEGRFPDGTPIPPAARFPGFPTPGAANVRPLTEVVISEVLSHTDLPFEDAIELQNVSQGYVDLSGWFLSDSRNDLKRFRIPDGTVLPPGGFIVFYEYLGEPGGFNPDFGIPPSFALSSSQGDDVFLSTADAQEHLTGFRTTAKFGPIENKVSLGRYETSTGVDFVALNQRTFGVDNPLSVGHFRTGTGLSNAAPRVGPIVINEIQYHPPDINLTNDNVLDEFIELYNVSSTNVALFDPFFPTNRWRIRDAVKFDFPGGVVMSPGSYLLVVSFDPGTNANALAAFRAKYSVGGSVPIFGPYSGKLSNDSEDIELKKPDTPQQIGAPNEGMVPYILVDRVKYFDAAPWPAFADGTGASLQRVVPGNYGNDPVNWKVGSPTAGAVNGSASGTTPLISSQPVSRTVTPGASATFSVTATGTPVLGYQWRVDGRDIPDATNSSWTVANAQIADSGDYRVLIHNLVGATLSAPATLTVQSAPVIVQQPASRVLAAGSTAIFTVAVTGSQPMTFQWRKDNNPLTGATNSVLRISNVQVANEGTYSVVVANAFGTATSDPATLAIEQPPQIVAQPQDLDLFVGATATFSVSATGTVPLRYQWRFNNAALFGQTNATLVLSNLTLAQAGQYSVTIVNSVGTITSDPATLIVRIPPTLSIVATDAAAAEPSGNNGAFLIVRAGSTNTAVQAVFSISGTATPGLDYAALTSPVLIPAGATSAPLAVLVLDDALAEPPETVIVTLESGSGYVLQAPLSATVTIGDEDNVGPAVALLSPLPDTLYTAPVNVPLEASATDFDGLVARVEFFANQTNKLGEATNAPFAFTWMNAPYGEYVLTALATDNLGASTLSEEVPITINAPPVAAITSPASGSFFLVPADITVRAAVSDSDGSITQVEFLEGTNVLAVRTTAPYEFDWLDVPMNTYTLRVRATDNRGATTLSPAVIISVGVQLPAFTDNFAPRGLILGFTNFVRGTNVNYTKEPGEPNHAQRAGIHTAWISWLAPASGPCTMDTFGSDFDTAMAVYTGDRVDALTEIASNDDAVGTPLLQSRVTFDALAGSTYHVAVTGYSDSDFGVFHFHQSLPNTGPVITAHPQSQTVNQGANVTFTVIASGGSSITYQWRFNNQDVPGQTGASLSLQNVQSAQAGTYTVVVSNPGGSVTSLPASLTVRVPPQITSHPQPQVVNAGESVSLSVTATGTAPLSYQWRLNGLSIPAATNAALLFIQVAHTNGGSYSVSVLNAAGSAISQPAEVIVRPRFVSFEKMVDGRFRLTYQGTPSRRYALEASTNLLHWSSLTTLTNTVVEEQYMDPSAVDRTWQNYRLQWVP